MKNKMLLVAGAALVTTVATTSVFADFGKGMFPQLSTEEKTKIESMTQEERQTYFETQRTQMQAEMEAREAVIDKLLNGETLTDADKVIVEDIKAQRAEQKAKKTEMEANREKMDAIQTKLKNGETLTLEEQALVDEMKSHKKEDGRGFGGKRGGHEKGEGKGGFGKKLQSDSETEVE